MRIAERCLVVPEGWEGPKPWKPSTDRWPMTCLVIHTTCEDAPGEPLRIGVGIIHTPIGSLVRVFYAEGYEEEARALAERHRASALPVQDFVRRFVSHHAKKGAVVAGWVTGVDLSRMAVGWNRRDADHFTLYLASRPPKEGEPNKRHPVLGNEEVADTTVLSVLVTPLDGQHALLSFSSDFWKARSGPLLDLRVWAEGLAGKDLAEGEFVEACNLFDVGFPVTGDLVERAVALVGLYDALLAAHDSLGLPILPSKVYGPGSYAKALLASRGIDRGPEMSSADADRAIRALFGGESFPYVCRYPVPVAPLDYSGCYLAAAVLTDSFRLYRGERIVAHEIEAEEATSTVERIAASYRDWLRFDGPPPTKEDGHFLLTTEFEIEPHNDVLPHHPSGKKDDTMRVAPVIASSEPLLRMGGDVVRTILQAGKTPHFLSAWQYVPEGDRAPGTSDPSVELWTLRKRLEADTSIPANERRWRDGWAKSVANALASGLPLEVHDRKARKRERVTIGDENDAFPVETVEEPGPFHCPVIAAGTMAYARLLQYLVTALVEEWSGAPAYTDTDAVRPIACREEGRTVFVPSLGEQRALSYREVDEVRWKIDELLGDLVSALPSGPRRTVLLPVGTQLARRPVVTLPQAVPEPRFLKLEPEGDRGISGFPLAGPYLYAIASKAYVVFYIRYRGPHVEIRTIDGMPRGVVVADETPEGIEIVGYSKHGLVQHVGRGGWRKEVWEHILTSLPWDEIIGPNAIEKKALPFVDAPHLAIVRATRMADVRAIPGMRPMARMISATRWRLRGLATGHPVAAYYEGFEPFSADWYEWNTGHPLRLVPFEEWDADADRPDVLPANDMGSFVSRFARRVPKRAVTPEGDAVTSKTRGAILPAPIIVTGMDRVGKQTHHVADQGTVGSGLPVRGTTTYREAHRIEDVLTFLRCRARELGASQIIREAAEDGIPERTLKRALSSQDGYRPNKETARVLVSLAERLAEEHGFSVEESILRQRNMPVCQGCGAPLKDGLRKWCSNACRHRAHRARTREDAR